MGAAGRDGASFDGGGVVFPVRGYERLELCPHDHLCMKLIEPETVLDQALDMLARPLSGTRQCQEPHCPAQATATSDAKAPADDGRC
jgi:hypothetical protein